MTKQTVEELKHDLFTFSWNQKFQKKEAPTLKRCKKHICNGKGKIYLQKSEISSQRRNCFFTLFEKVKKLPLYKLKKTQNLFIHVSFTHHHRAHSPKKEKKSLSLGEIGQKLKALGVDTLHCALEAGAVRRWTTLCFGVVHRRTALHTGQSTRNSPKFSQNLKFFLSNSVKLLSEVEEKVSTSFPSIFTFPFAFHVNNFSS